MEGRRAPEIDGRGVTLLRDVESGVRILERLPGRRLEKRRQLSQAADARRLGQIVTRRLERIPSLS